MTNYVHQPLNPTTESSKLPSVGKRIFQLTKDTVGTEFFFATQIICNAATAPALVCLDSGQVHANGSPIVNPVYAPFSGALVPGLGRGYLTTGKDINNVSFTTDATVTQVIAHGGDATGGGSVS
jgi:hypothetical protein